VLFNSYPFILLFLPVTIIGYFYLTKQHFITAAKAWLVLASLAFYGWWNMAYLPLMVGSILFNFAVGTILVQGPSKKHVLPPKRILQVGLLMNISLLGYFKYTDFFLDNINILYGTHYLLPNILLPLGISFFTITQITYLVDCYEGLVKEMDFLNYLLFVTFFPHLLMGPILHHKQMMPQFDSLRSKVFQPRNFMYGILLFTIGLVKKVLLADTFASWANQGFTAGTQLTVLEAWAVSLSYTFQLYFDFSGYSDMALGTARMFNIHLPINFNTPYKATTIIEFWQRWHISLTQFITTYLYTPILKGMGKITFANAMLATFIAMVIAGLWHQAGWGFLLFYILHAMALIMNHWWRRRKYKLPTALAWLLTFLFVNFTLVIMRSPELTTAFAMIRTMLGWGRFVIPDVLLPYLTWLPGITIYGAFTMITLQTLSYLIVGFLLSICWKNSQQLATSIRPNYASALVVATALIITLLHLNQVSEFLYFKF